MEKMTAETILSFFKDFTPVDFSSRTKDQTKHSLELFAKVWQDVCQELQKIENTEFKLETCINAEGGGLVLAIVYDGNVFSKANVCISVVTGKVPANGIKILQEVARIPAENETFTENHSLIGIAISSVIHAKNPHVPSLHFNLRHFVMKLENGAEVGWYGGGIDISPSYLVPEDATHFHKTLKHMCDQHDASYYPRFKKWCDKYFLNQHRGETRGLGGIFFDNLTSEKEGNFSFLESCGKAILPAYLPILKTRICDTFTDKEMAWKQIRNSRYIEFNLLHDKGIKFGLRLPGFQMETLFHSLPPTALWGYKSDPEPGSREDQMVRVLRCPREWA